MNYSDAIDIVNTYFCPPSRTRVERHNEERDKSIEALSMVNSAVKKQIPTECVWPLEDKGSFANCPTCKSEITGIEREQISGSMYVYCRDCGQKIFMKG